MNPADGKAVILISFSRVSHYPHFLDKRFFKMIFLSSFLEAMHSGGRKIAQIALILFQVCQQDHLRTMR